MKEISRAVTVISHLLPHEQKSRKARQSNISMTTANMSCFCRLIYGIKNIAVLSGLRFTSFSAKMGLLLHSRVKQVNKSGFIMKLPMFLFQTDRRKYTQMHHSKNYNSVDNGKHLDEEKKTTKRQIIYCKIHSRSPCFILHC